MKVFTFFKKIGCIVFLALTILMGINTALRYLNVGYYVVLSYGSSMQPTLSGSRDLQLIEAISEEDELELSDIIFFINPDGDFCIKRIVGLPGDTIAFQGGTLIRNSEEIEEDYILVDEKYSKTYSIEVATCGEGEYYVLGDNRGVSYDSRHYGCIAFDDILGKVILAD